MSGMVDMLLWMLIGHAVADYPLQGDWLSKAKNPNLAPVPDQRIWPLALICHAAIHAGAVKLATGSWVLAGFEFTAHALIDYQKCMGRLTYNADQVLHLVAKVAWFGLALASPAGWL